MSAVRLWAPRARQVQLVLSASGESIALSAADDGWWEGPPLTPGTDYAFRIDGADPLPDPRSAWQPDSVHGDSRWFDTGEFDWTDSAWAGRSVLGAVIYELHIGTFTAGGTLDSAIDRLPYLAGLGVEFVELMPVAAFGGRRGWGYDGVALYAVHDAYGGPAALQRFVDAAHHHGLGVILDVVYNHLGPSGNYLPQFGPYFSGHHHTPWGEGVNLDDDHSPAVRSFIIDNAVRWLRDFHIDGLRLDAVHELKDDSDTHVLAELATTVAELSDQVGRPLGLIAESDLNDASMVTATSDGGYGMDAQWDDDVHHAIHAFLTEERHGYYGDFGSAPVLAKALTEVFVHDGSHSTFRGQTWGAPVAGDVNGHRFVAAINTHDQVGNRALGDRPAATLSPGRLAIAATLLLTSHYTPMLFMGEEWGAATPWMYFTDHAEPELGEAVAQGRQREFGDHGWAQLYGREDLQVPDPQARSTFEASILNWSEHTGGAHARLLGFYRALIALRREVADLSDGDRTRTSVEFDADAGWLAMRRGDTYVVINTGDATTIAVPEIARGPREVMLSWDPVADTDLTTGAIRLGPDNVAILR